MNDFFQYVAAMWQLFIQDLGRFLKLTFVDPWSEVGQNFRDYNDLLNLYKPGFGAGGWILDVKDETDPIKLMKLYNELLNGLETIAK